LTGRVHRALEIPVLPLDLDIRLVNAIPPVGRLQIRTAAFVEFESIDLHPAPDASGIPVHAAFGQEFGDVLVGQAIA
jgi:hypothetical protein